MSKFVTLHGFGGGGTNLNFDIKKYSTEEELLADTPSENTIGIITDTAINGYRFSATEPTDMKPGEVWIMTGDSSEVNFNIINNVYIYPISIYQYINGDLVTKTAKTYLNSQWIDWIRYLYKNSVYNEVFDKYIFVAGVGSITEKADHVLLTRSAETNSQIGWWTFNKIDLSKYKKIHAEVNCTSVGVNSANGDWRYRFGAFTNKIAAGVAMGSSTVYMSAGTTFSSNGVNTVYTVDVTSLNDSYYIGIQGTGIAKVYKIWLE